MKNLVRTIKTAEVEGTQNNGTYATTFDLQQALSTPNVYWTNILQKKDVLLQSKHP